MATERDRRADFREAVRPADASRSESIFENGKSTLFRYSAIYAERSPGGPISLVTDLVTDLAAAPGSRRILANK